jgi:hypothetical protein
LIDDCSEEDFLKYNIYYGSFCLGKSRIIIDTLKLIPALNDLDTNVDLLGITDVEKRTVAFIIACLDAGIILTYLFMVIRLVH